jgi:hypothetical protein
VPGFAYGLALYVAGTFIFPDPRTVFNTAGFLILTLQPRAGCGGNPDQRQDLRHSIGLGDHH